MERQGKREYPIACPVCRFAMIGEKSEPDVARPDIHRCLNCGAVVDFSGRADGDDEEG